MDRLSKATSAPPRRRRTADDSRAAILAAAEKLLQNRSPDALRLQEVAAAAQISHPTLLHHFGSREGLVEALNQKTANDIAEYLESFVGNLPDAPPDLIGTIFEKFRGGQAQRLAWLAMGQDTEVKRSPYFERIVTAATALRTELGARQGAAEPTRDDMEFIFHLVLVTAVGEAIVGVMTWNAGAIHDAINAVATRYGVTLGQVAQPLRAAASLICTAHIGRCCPC